MDPALDPAPSDEGLAASSIVFALLAAVAGALGWAAIAYFTGYEVGYVAWALGALVGAAMVKFGGRGNACAGAAAVLTVAAIAGGKLLATRFLVEQGFDEACVEFYTPALHAELVRDAADHAALGEDPSDAELRTFLVEHAFTEAETPDDVHPGELAEFRATTALELARLHANQPSYANWYAENVAESRRDFEQEFSLVQANVESLNGFDALFVFLGVSTAFGMVRRASPPDDEPEAPAT